jgi:hypothetical protein
MNKTKKYGNFPAIRSADITLSINESGRTVDAIQRQEKVGHILSTILTYVIIGFLALARGLPVLLDDHHLPQDQ